MATQQVVLASTPVDLGATLSLDPDRTYRLQNQGSRVAYIRVGATADGPAERLYAGANLDYDLPASEKLWGWGDGPVSVLEVS